MCRHGVIGHYVHSQIVDSLGRIGVIVALESTGSAEPLRALGRHVAMHIAAASPLALDPTGIDPATIAREKAVLADKNAGKPAQVLEKIVESGLKTFYKEVCLLDQPYVHDPAKIGRPGGQGGGEDRRRADRRQGLRPLRARRRRRKAGRRRLSFRIDRAACGPPFS